MVEERLATWLTCEHNRNLMGGQKEMGFLARGTTRAKSQEGRPSLFEE